MMKERKEVEKEIVCRLEELKRLEMEEISLGAEDEETVKFYREIVVDQMEKEYQFLRWCEDSYRPNKLLYLGCGLDRVPECVWDRGKIIYVSMEDYLLTELGTKQRKYFSDLEEGLRVIANGQYCPLANEAVDAVFIQSLPKEVVLTFREEILRVLKEKGKLLLSESVFDGGGDIKEVLVEDEYREIEIPKNINTTSVSESKFFVLEK